MTTELILVLITLASTIVGTLLSPRLWVKTSIIVLACAATTATLVKSYDDALDNAFVKRALAAQLATSTPTPDYQRVLDKTLERVANTHKLRWDGSVKKDRGTLYYFSQQQSDIRVGALCLSLQDNGDAFVKYVSRQPLDKIVEAAMFTPLDVSVQENLQGMLDDLAFVANIAIDDDVKWVTSATTMVTTTALNPVAVSVSATEHEHRLTVGLDKPFIDTLVALPPIERNWKAYQEVERKLRSEQ